MSENLRRRGISRGNGPAARRARRAGQPNVLSDAATPNVLSTPVASGAPADVRRANQGVWLETGRPTPAAGSRLPSFGTLIFLIFLAITIFRVIGELASGFGEPTTAPPTTAPAGSGGRAAPGTITYNDPDTYRVEVRAEPATVLHAAGEHRIRGT